MRIGLLLVTLLSLHMPVAFAHRPYTVRELWPGPMSEALAINNAGEVAGAWHVVWSEYRGPRRAAVWSADGHLVDLGPGECTAINNLGKAAGSLSGHGPFIWSPGGSMEYLYPQIGWNSRISDMNDLGHLVGDEPYEPSSSFFWSPECGKVTIQPPPGFHPECVVTALNSGDQAVGYSSLLSDVFAFAWRSFIWTRYSGAIALAQPEYYQTFAADINDHRQVVGGADSSYIIPLSVGFPPLDLATMYIVMWNPDGIFRSIGFGSSPHINSRGQIAYTGPYTYESSTWRHYAMLRDPDGSSTVLPDLPGTAESTATAINDRGVIAGIAVETVGERMIPHAVVWEPVRIAVEVDIKPGAFPNTVNLNSKGATPVAILASSEFDPAEVDPATVTLAGAPVAQSPNGKYRTAMEDVNGDGLGDLVLHIVTAQMEIEGESATLEGELYNGGIGTGSDSVVLVPVKE